MSAFMSRTAWTGMIAILAMSGCAIVDRISGEHEARSIRERGVPAIALVLGIRDTGITINDDPVVDLELEVRPEQGAPYTAQTRSLISRLHTPMFQPGTVLSVVVDPANRSRVALDVYETRK